MVPDQFLPQDLLDKLNDPDVSIEDALTFPEDFIDIAKDNAGYFALVLFGVIMAILIYIIGKNLPSITRSSQNISVGIFQGCSGALGVVVAVVERPKEDNETMAAAWESRPSSCSFLLYLESSACPGSVCRTLS